MDNTNEKESHILPQPERSSRTSTPQEGAPNSAPVQPERTRALSAEKEGSPPPASGSQPVAPVNDDGAVADDASSASGSSATSTPLTPSDTPMIADDNDLIEKEWVSKAKQIVDQTKDDPYNQNRQIVRLRADYLKKRYNKDVKMHED